jgi:hypothetical protein
MVWVVTFSYLCTGNKYKQGSFHQKKPCLHYPRRNIIIYSPRKTL